MRTLVNGLKAIVWFVHPWVTKPRTSYLNLLRIQNKYFNQLAVSAMPRLGYAPHPIHPKHLFGGRDDSHLHALIRPGMAFLDVGSGVGSDCIEAARCGAAPSIGIENNPDSIRVSLARAREENVTIQVHQLDLEAGVLPFADATFDLINFSNVLEHLNNRTAILRELKRIKKPAAPILISIPNSDTAWKRRLRSAGLDSRDDTDHKIEYSRASLHAELQQAGLTIASELKPIVPSFPWHGLIALSAVLSPRLFTRLQAWKHAHAQRHPDESIGWTFHAV